ncbi:hypothetical protein [Aeromicrobium wangtongii]|uniref:hypothetical protein n=1 Tax=Aeromicrobium wangtongii TaxID=2969247 RepID=UPI002017A49B|nr:hypothetical protein [Aeromicrobium wangtongii]MCL3817844.1 hypothetical protein [Aeromicrobium wangtongii]
MATDLQGDGQDAATGADRIARVEAFGAAAQVRRLLAVGRRGLPLGYDADTGQFAQTVRRSDGPGGRPRPEGASLRYAAMAALGLSRLDASEQRAVLGGITAAELARATGVLAREQDDPGAVALAAWAVAETAGTIDTALFSRLGATISSGRPLETVTVSWIVTAAVAAGGELLAMGEAMSARLLAAQGAEGIYPHVVPATAQNRWRRHVGSFADQVYPIQALARMSRASGDTALLRAADATASRICELQGPEGQWWWHYDARTGDVVERYPVYSVHQHAMAPMVLFDLVEAGGTDHTSEIVRGLRWLEDHPEVDEPLVADAVGLIWRKAGRREPAKAVRRLSAVTTAIRPGMHLPGLDRVFPASRVDHECRPYELGWLLYAWLPARGVTA